MSKISVIIAVLNEEKTIGKVVDDINKYLKAAHLTSEIIIVDNGSKDRTKEIVLSKKVKLIEKKKKGKGEAVLAGIKEAGGDILLFIDGDNTYPAETIPKLIDPLIKGEKDIIYGSRFLGNSIEISPLRKLGNRVITFIASKLYCPTTDLLTGMVASRRNKFLELNLKSKGFEIETELFIKSFKANFNVMEFPISYKERKGSKLNPLLDGIKILKTLLKYKL